MTRLALLVALLVCGCESKESRPAPLANAVATAPDAAAPAALAVTPPPPRDRWKCTPDLGPCEGEGVLSSGGLERTFRFHLPKRGASKPGLVVALHGHGGDARSFEAGSHFDKVGDEHDFAVVYPNGVDKSWNSFDAKSGAAKAGVDDVAFVSALIDRGIADFGADPAHVLVAGFSNGGMMAERIGCELADKVSAIAPASGPMAVNEASSCKPSKPISVILFHGDADPRVPFAGRPDGEQTGALMSPTATIAKWAALNHCAATPVTSNEPDVDPNDGTRAKRATYGGCANGVRVVFFTIEGGVHAWPAGPDASGKASKKEGVSHDVDASETIWKLSSGS